MVKNIITGQNLLPQLLNGLTASHTSIARLNHRQPSFGLSTNFIVKTCHLHVLVHDQLLKLFHTRPQDPHQGDKVHNTRHVEELTLRAIREDSFVDFVWRNVSGTFREVGVLLLDISVEMEFIDFLQPRIKQNCEKNRNYT